MLYGFCFQFQLYRNLENENKTSIINLDKYSEILYRKTELFRQNIGSNCWNIRHERSDRHDSFSIRLRCHGASVAFSWSKYV